MLLLLGGLSRGAEGKTLLASRALWRRLLTNSPISNTPDLLNEDAALFRLLRYYGRTSIVCAIPMKGDSHTLLITGLGLNFELGTHDF